MNIRHALVSIAAATLLAPAAFAATTTHKDDCASAMKKADAALAANANASQKAKDARAEGEKLCNSGKTADGVKKLHEAAKDASAKATTKSK